MVGSIAMVVGAVDPMEGSAIILPGSGLVALGTFLSHSERRLIAFRVWVFILIAIGVGSLWGLSRIGGIGGNSGHSLWWGLLILPYLIGWSMGIWGPGSPRWLLVLGIVVSLFYMALPPIIVVEAYRSHHQTTGEKLLAPIIIGGLGLLTILGCIRRLRRRIG
jgi:hypothetical protein